MIKQFFQTKVGYFIQILDTYTGQSPIPQGLQLYLENRKVKFLIKKEGYLIILEPLHEGTYTFEVVSPYYKPHRYTLEIKTQVGRDELPDLLFLEPSLTYPYSSSDVEFRVRAIGQHDEPISDLYIVSYLNSDHPTTAATVSTEEQTAPNMIRTLSRAKLICGGWYWIQEKGSAQGEFIRLGWQMDELTVYRLIQPLQFQYKRAFHLFPACITQTDQHGTAILRFSAERSELLKVKWDWSLQPKQVYDWKEVDQKQFNEYGWIVIRNEKNYPNTKGG